MQQTQICLHEFDSCCLLMCMCYKCLHKRTTCGQQQPRRVETPSINVTLRAAECSGDVTQINVGDIWSSQKGAGFSRSAAPRSTEIPNLSVTNECAQQQLGSGSQKRSHKLLLLPHLQHGKMVGCIQIKRVRLLFKGSCQKPEGNDSKEHKC